MSQIIVAGNAVPADVASGKRFSAGAFYDAVGTNTLAAATGSGNASSTEVLIQDSDFGSTFRPIVTITGLSFAPKNINLTTEGFNATFVVSTGQVIYCDPNGGTWVFRKSQNNAYIVGLPDGFIMPLIGVPGQFFQWQAWS